MRREGYKKEESRYTRIPVEYKATYTLGRITGEGIITDISEGGIAMRTRQAFAVGDELKIQSRITSNLILEFTGEVQSYQGNILGIQIKEIDPEIMRRFKDHVGGMLRVVSRASTEEYKLAVKSIKKKRRQI